MFYNLYASGRLIYFHCKFLSLPTVPGLCIITMVTKLKECSAGLLFDNVSHTVLMKDALQTYLKTYLGME